MEPWKIDEKSSAATKADLVDPLAAKKWPSFEANVADNPFFHPKAKRIKKLEKGTSFPDGTYRYRNDPLRVVYYPDKDDRTVYPLAAGSASNIAYKKKSKK